MSFIKGISDLAKGRVNQARKFATKNVLKNIGTPILTLQKGLAELNGKVLKKQETFVTRARDRLNKSLNGGHTGSVTPAETTPSTPSTPSNPKSIASKLQKSQEAVTKLNTTIGSTKTARQETISKIGKQHDFIGLDNKTITGSKVKTFQLNDPSQLKGMKHHVENSDNLNHAHFETGALLKLLNAVGDTHKDKIITALSGKEKFTKQFDAYSAKIDKLKSGETTIEQAKASKAKDMLLSKLGISESDYEKIKKAKAAKEATPTPITPITNGSDDSDNRSQSSSSLIIDKDTFHDSVQNESQLTDFKKAEPVPVPTTISVITPTPNTSSQPSEPLPSYNTDAPTVTIQSDSESVSFSLQANRSDVSFLSESSTSEANSKKASF